MSREGIVERAEAPELRRSSPAGKWVFGGGLLVAGLGILAMLWLNESQKGAAPSRQMPEEKKAGLDFGGGDFELPTFSAPVPEPEPEAVPEPQPPALAAAPPRRRCRRRRRRACSRRRSFHRRSPWPTPPRTRKVPRRSPKSAASHPP